MLRSVLVLLALAPVAYANPGKPDGEDSPPKVTRTQLTLQQGNQKAAKALVQHVDVEHPRMMQPCPVHLALTLQHPKVKTVEVSFTYGSEPKKNHNLPLAIVGATKNGKVDVTFKKQGAGGLQTLVTKLDAPFDVGGVKFDLRGTVEIANTTCAFDAI